MSRADTLLTMPAIRSDRAVPRSLGSLIEVPEVKRSPVRRARPRVAGHWQGRRPAPVRPKRRLRREVRIAGCALLALAPLVSACTLGWSGRPARVLACSIAEATAADQGFDDSAVPQRPVQPVGGAARRFPRSGRPLDRAGSDGPGHRHGGSRGLPRLCLARRQPRGLHA